MLHQGVFWGSETRFCRMHHRLEPGQIGRAQISQCSSKISEPNKFLVVVMLVCSPLLWSKGRYLRQALRPCLMRHEHETEWSSLNNIGFYSHSARVTAPSRILPVASGAMETRVFVKKCSSLQKLPRATTDRAAAHDQTPSKSACMKS